jgi:phospholipid/cholesterol/gamma-HCH transport system ATP-binding protein
MSAPDHLVEIRDLHFSYGPRPVLRGIDLDIPRGKVVAILGTSGSGKTTLLQLIGGSLKPLRGTINVCGWNVPTLTREELYTMRRQMGVMFQKGGLFSDLTVHENVAFPIREHTKLPESVIHDLVVMKLHAVGLRGAHAMKPNDLSGGMTRRVALARAIATDPKLMMYDEPFAGLDPIALAVVGRLIRRLNDALGATSIIVSHDVHECLQIVDYLYFVSEGRVMGEGTPGEVRAADNAFVRQFVHGEIDGAIPFHVPARAYAADAGLAPGPGRA